MPTEIKLRQRSRVLEVSFDDGSRFELPFEYLRVHSPSAEVQGHGAGSAACWCSASRTSACARWNPSASTR